jgi:hypothetical protein
MREGHVPLAPYCPICDRICEHHPSHAVAWRMQHETRRLKHRKLAIWGLLAAPWATAAGYILYTYVF